MKKISKLSILTIGSLRVAAFMVVAFIFLFNKKPLIFVIFASLSLIGFVIELIALDFMKDNKPSKVTAILVLIFVTIVGGITSLLYDPNKEALDSNKKKKHGNKNYLMTKKERVILTIIFVALLIYALTLIYPFFYLLVNSFKTFEDFYDNPLWFSPHAVFSNYIAVFTNEFAVTTFDGVSVGILQMFWNSLSLSVVETLVSMFFTCCAAYVLAKYDFVGNKVIYSIVIISMVIPSIAAITATYKLMTDTRLIGTFVGMVILDCGAFGGGFLYIHSYFKNIPWSFAESAMIDGASDFKIFYRIMVPMAKNGILTFTILRFLGSWNSYWIPHLFYQEHPTIAVGLAKLSNEASQGKYPMLFAAMIVSIVPVLIFYAIFQKSLLANTIDGGLK